jgi:predicted SAM-dependent methyltransferase
VGRAQNALLLENSPVIPQIARKAYFAVAFLPMRLNGHLYRTFRAPRTGTVKVHLGPGQGNYLDGWINVDANLLTAKIDLWADLTGPLPFHDSTIDVVHTHHVIEHLPHRNLPGLFKEIHRCLKPGGCIRVCGPDAEAAAKKLVAGDIAWFSSDFPDRRTSIGGRFANFLLCGGEHVALLTESYLAEVAGDAGFVNIRRRMPVRETGYPRLIDSPVLSKEFESDFETPHTLVVEAERPF